MAMDEATQANFDEIVKLCSEAEIDEEKLKTILTNLSDEKQKESLTLLDESQKNKVVQFFENTIFNFQQEIQGGNVSHAKMISPMQGIVNSIKPKAGKVYPIKFPITENEYIVFDLKKDKKDIKTTESEKKLILHYQIFKDNYPLSKGGYLAATNDIFGDELKSLLENALNMHDQVQSKNFSTENKTLLEEKYPALKLEIENENTNLENPLNGEGNPSSSNSASVASIFEEDQSLILTKSEIANMSPAKRAELSKKLQEQQIALRKQINALNAQLTEKNEQLNSATEIEDRDKKNENISILADKIALIGLEKPDSNVCIFFDNSIINVVINQNKRASLDIATLYGNKTPKEQSDIINLKRKSGWSEAQIKEYVEDETTKFEDVKKIISMSYVGFGKKNSFILDALYHLGLINLDDLDSIVKNYKNPLDEVLMSKSKTTAEITNYNTLEASPIGRIWRYDVLGVTNNYRPSEQSQYSALASKLVEDIKSMDKDLMDTSYRLKYEGPIEKGEVQLKISRFIGGSYKEIPQTKLADFGIDDFDNETIVFKIKKDTLYCCVGSKELKIGNKSIYEKNPLYKKIVDQITEQLKPIQLDKNNKPIPITSTTFTEDEKTEIFTLCSTNKLITEKVTNKATHVDLKTIEDHLKQIQELCDINYKCKFIDENSLDPILDNEIGVYFKDGQMYCKIKDKDPIPLNREVKAGIDGYIINTPISPKTTSTNDNTIDIKLLNGNIMCCIKGNSEEFMIYSQNQDKNSGMIPDVYKSICEKLSSNKSLSDTETLAIRNYLTNKKSDLLNKEAKGGVEAPQYDSIYAEWITALDSKKGFPVLDEQKNSALCEELLMKGEITVPELSTINLRKRLYESIHIRTYGDRQSTVKGLVKSDKKWEAVDKLLQLANAAKTAYRISKECDQSKIEAVNHTINQNRNREGEAVDQNAIRDNLNEMNNIRYGISSPNTTRKFTKIVDSLSNNFAQYFALVLADTLDSSTGGRDGSIITTKINKSFNYIINFNIVLAKNEISSLKKMMMKNIEDIINNHHLNITQEENDTPLSLLEKIKESLKKSTNQDLINSVDKMHNQCKSIACAEKYLGMVEGNKELIEEVGQQKFAESIKAKNEQSLSAKLTDSNKKKIESLSNEFGTGGLAKTSPSAKEEKIKKQESNNYAASLVTLFGAALPTTGTVVGQSAGPK